MCTQQGAQVCNNIFSFVYINKYFHKGKNKDLESGCGSG